MGQLWVSSDGYLASPKLSRVLRTATAPECKFRQFADVKDAAMQGKNKGDTFHWDVYSKVTTQGRKLTETNTMPETNYTVTQGTMTITEYGNSVPYSGKLDDLSEFSVKEIINKVLKDDAKKAFDIDCHAEFNRCKLRVVGSGTNVVTLTTNGTATATNNVAMGKGHVNAIIDTMKERDIKPFSGDDYMCIAHPTTLRTFKDDLEEVRKYTTEGFQQMKYGEAGRYGNCRFIEQNNIPKGGAADSTTFDPYTDTADEWNNGKSGWAFFFGDDTVAEGVAVPEEMRGKIPTDYGRSKGIAWYALSGFGIVHNTADKGNARIVKWDSAV